VIPEADASTRGLDATPPPASATRRFRSAIRSSNRMSSITVLKSRIRSRSYVFAFGLFSHATATPPSFWSSMYFICMGPSLWRASEAARRL